MKFLAFFLLIFSCQAHAGCISSYCADGYTGCGCGPESAECCRRRIEGSGGGSGGVQAPGPELQFLDQGMKLMEKNIQLQQQKQKMHLDMMKQGDEQVGRQKIREGQELDDYHEQENKKRIKKQNEVKQVKDRLIGLENGFKPLKLEDSRHQLKYKQESEEKYGQRSEKKQLVPMVEEPQITNPVTRNPESCKASSSEYPNRCITNACGVSSSESLCCPKDFPYLNHCDCMCYESTDFVCGGYSACQHYRENK